MKNPFVYGKSVVGEEFADRKEEIRELMLDLKSGQNVLIYSPRRYGKTSLMLEVLSRLRAEGFLTIYVDLFPLTTLTNFAELYAAAIAQAVETTKDKIVNFLKKILSVSPKVTVGEKVRIEFGLPAVDPADVLSKLYDLPEEVAKKKKKKAVVVFDEFQEIAKLDGEQIERELRTKIQHHRRVAYVFMGSKRHLLRLMFQTKARALYKIAKVYPLGKIEVDGFKEFIRRKFRDGGFTITDESVSRILEMSQGHPYYTQQLCHELWNLCQPDQKIEVADVEAAIGKMLTINSEVYTQIWEGLTWTQRAVLSAIAKDIRDLHSREFVVRYGLASPQHVQKALLALDRKELVERSDGRWEVTDIFFKEWLRRLG